jgi:hypothetical protein
MFIKARERCDSEFGCGVGKERYLFKGPGASYRALWDEIGDGRVDDYALASQSEHGAP